MPIIRLIDSELDPERWDADPDRSHRESLEWSDSNGLNAYAIQPPVFVDTDRMVAHVLNVPHNPDLPMGEVNGHDFPEGFTDQDGMVLVSPAVVPITVLPAWWIVA